MNDRETQADLAAAVRAAQAGDQAAWDELFARATPRVRAYIELRLGASLRREADVEDVVQDSYLAASEALADFDADDAPRFTAWLCRIAEHRIARLAQHHGAEKRRRPEVTERLTLALQRIEAQRGGPATMAAARDEATQLREAVAALDEELRAVVLLRFFEQRTLSEMAAALGRSETSVRRAVGRAMRELGALLEGGAR